MASSTVRVTAPDAGHLPGTPEYRRILIALFAAGVATFVLIWAPQALLPGLASSFGISPSTSALALSGTTAVLAACLLVAGPLSERIGRTWLIHGSVWASAWIAIGCALAPNWSTLVALRCLEGITLAGLPAVATAYLREELHPNAQAQAAGLYIGGTALGGMIGRLATASVLEFAGWRWALGAAAVVALVCATVVALTLPPSRHFHRPDTSVGLLRSTRTALGDRVLLALYGLGAIGMGVLSATFNTLGFRLTEAPFGLSVGAFGLLYLVYPLGTVSSAVSGRSAGRHDERAVLATGAALTLAGALVTLSGSLSVVICGTALIVVGFFGMHSVCSGWVVRRAHLVGAGTSQAAALYLFTYYVGAAGIGVLATTVWSHAHWPGVIALVAVLLCGAGGLIAVLPQDHDRQPSTAQLPVD